MMGIPGQGGILAFHVFIAGSQSGVRIPERNLLKRRRVCSQTENQYTPTHTHTHAHSQSFGTLIRSCHILLVMDYYRTD